MKAAPDLGFPMLNTRARLNFLYLTPLPLRSGLRPYARAYALPPRHPHHQVPPGGGRPRPPTAGLPPPGPQGLRPPLSLRFAPWAGPPNSHLPPACRLIRVQGASGHPHPPGPKGPTPPGRGGGCGYRIPPRPALRAYMGRCPIPPATAQSRAGAVFRAAARFYDWRQGGRVG